MKRKDSCWSRDCSISGALGRGCGRSLRQAGKPDRGCGSNDGHRRDTERNRSCHRAEESFDITDNQLAYAEAGQSDVYVETDELKLLSEDKLSILSRYDMPELEP